MLSELINKYNIPGPRYTSYPTVPYWQEDTINHSIWKESILRSYQESNNSQGISIYIHLPFCESLCTFCACHKRITRRHNVEEPYIATLLKEWKLYSNLLGDTPKIKEIHLGGGTPTFFRPGNLKTLINGLFETGEICEDFEFSFEGHPNNTTREHLQELYDLGFRRTSFGVQDYDPKVQQTINRIQPFERVKTVTEWAREVGYESIAHDLIFGLPHQTAETISNTIEHTKELLPDRIAFYSYAHVPWIKNVGQRGYNEEDLPGGKEKRKLYEIGKKMLSEMGYKEIGMDHFSLDSDSLYSSMKSKTLHRNFMGYTANKTQVMIGLGMSAISDSWYGFGQNLKSVEEYTNAVNKNLLPIFRGHKLSDKDLVIRQHILNIMCHFETSWKHDHMQFSELDKCIERLSEMQKDGLVFIENKTLRVPDHARPFVRNICMAFDLHLMKKNPEKRIFSMTI
ncbi:oxygen-independent coproporphyrinogen III oxidase [Membranihabitans maritimus]|uniref:oxygen-independent coproporphyrinogen III oxidase n=1 Tax=Membranihabitans maritimus TaxID=2904244 RepID=UPI001F01F420|nr:oxygen-independent coproporphyrinogen III oxidase [Membranihabitans maritimus]